MGLRDQFDNTDASSKRIIMYDKQMHTPNNPQNHIECYKVNCFHVLRQVYQMRLNTKRSSITTTRPPNFTPIHSTASNFQLAGHFETSAPNDAKMTLNTKRSNAPHILQLLPAPPPRPQISLLALQPAVFQVQAILNTSAPNESKMTLKTKRSKALLIILQLPMSPKFHSVLFYGQPFSVTIHFERSAPNDPKMTLNTKRSKVPYTYITTANDSPNFTLFCFMSSRF